MNGIYTEKGIALAARVAAGTKLTITKVTAGSGTTATSALALAEEKQILTVGTAAVSGQTATLPVTLAEVKAGASYTLTELGVYARDPDAGEVLYQVFRLDESRAICAGGESVYRFYLRQSVGANGVTVSCSPTGLLIEEDLAPTRSKVLATTVPSRTVTLTAEELQGFLDALPRLLTENIDLIVSGTLTQTLLITGFYGSGMLFIMGNDALTLQKGVYVSCDVFVQITNTTILPNEAGSDSYCVCSSFPGCNLRLYQCTLTGNDSGMGLDLETGSAIVEDCSVTHHTIGVMARRGACVFITKDNSGVFSNNVTGVKVWRGGMVQLCQNAPVLLGGSTNEHLGGIIVDADGQVI